MSLEMSGAECQGGCRCRKVLAAAAGELQAGRDVAAEARPQGRRNSIKLKEQWGRESLLKCAGSTRMAVLQNHLVTPGFEYVPALLQMPSAASVDMMVSLLRELIAIPSVNPDQVLMAGVNPCNDPNCGEFKLSSVLAEKFRALGGEVVVEDCTANWSNLAQVGGFSPRQNVYGIWKSTDPAAKWIAIDDHLDTVMVTGMTPFEPFSADMTPDGKIHGRGSCDTKATFAIVMTILAEMQARGSDLPVNLILAGTVGEETGRLGANALREFLLRRNIFVDEMLVAEPTLCTPVYGHKGSVRLTFNIKGVAAHSSKPHLGKNALVAAAQLINRFYSEHEKLQAKPGGPLGNPTITPTLGGGGHGPNIVPQDAYVFVDYRVATIGTTSTSENPKEVMDWMMGVAHDVLDESIHCTGFEATNADQDGGAGNEAFFQDPSAPWVHWLGQCSGLDPEVVTFGTNATAYSQPSGTGIKQQSRLTAAGVSASAGRVYGTCVVMGPGDIAQAHMADEWVEIAQLTKMKAILEKWFQLN